MDDTANGSDHGHAGHPGGRWLRESSSPGWTDRVVAALAGSATTAARHSGLQVRDIRPAPHRGPSVIEVRYRPAATVDRDRGLRLDASIPPPVGGGEDEDLAEALASWVVTIELQEPRGNRRDDTWIDDEGVEWRAFPG
jgi:hypothetical protein